MIDIAILSPSFRDSVASERQWTPAMLRPLATFEAILLSSPPTVSESPTYGTRTWPVESGTTGFGMTNDSLNHALRIVVHAPATVACPAPYAGWVGQPSGNAIGRRAFPAGR